MRAATSSAKRGFDSVTGWIDFIQSGAGGAIQNLNYQWNEVGSLRERQDVRQGLTETFFYDHLHRLTSTSGPDPISIGYDPRGNILSRSGGHLGIGNGHSITWTSYNLPNTITDAVGNNASQFFYGPDRSRFKQVASYGGTTEQTIYIGGLIEKVTLGTVTSWRHTISGASGPVAIYTRKSSGANEIHYLTKDPLGSVDSVTDASGNVEVRLSFAASGQRRNENGWSGNPTSADWTQITDTTRRGFTSHEMLDNLNLTHMNGRVYDQLIGQFISPDPFIDGPGSTQGWNRYGYVHGNPLSRTDPSGYEEKTIKQWINRNEPSDQEGIIERVVVSASRYDNTNYNYAALNFSSDVRARAPDGISGGGGAIIEEVVTTATRIRPAIPMIPVAATANSTEPQVPQQNTKCPRVPTAPPDADVDVNVRVAQTHNTSDTPVVPTPYGSTGNLADLLRGPLWFYSQVDYNQGWDYKTKNPLGTQMYTDFGNFNFGATGRAVGFSAWELLWGAGLAQLHHDLQNGQLPQSISTRFDNPDDIDPILAGIQYYDAHCY